MPFFDWKITILFLYSHFNGNEEQYQLMVEEVTNHTSCKINGNRVCVLCLRIEARLCKSFVVPFHLIGSWYTWHFPSERSAL